MGHGAERTVGYTEVRESGSLIPSVVTSYPMEAYVCTSCGYIESYVKDPDKVPFEKLKHFSWVNPPAGGPCR
jgi:hypothetical protein